MEDNFSSSDSTGIQQSCYCCFCYVALWGEYDKNSQWMHYNNCKTATTLLRKAGKGSNGK